jgi:TrmH family RNA methyltransferase
VVSEDAETHDEIRELLACHDDVERIVLSPALFKDVSGVVSPVGILAVIALPAPAPPSLVEDCVVLDGVQDAGNVGTILRTAAAAGIGQAILGRGCAGVWTPRVLRAAQGGHFGLTLHEQIDLPEFLARYQGVSVAAVVSGGVPLYGFSCTDRLAWVFGSEGEGVSPEVLHAVRQRISIPMASGSESLNVASAAAVCLFEMCRQRRPQG